MFYRIICFNYKIILKTNKTDSLGGSLMINIDEVLNKVSKINCPVDEFENKIVEAFHGYNYKGEEEVIIQRTEDLDKENLEAYTAFINAQSSPEIVMLVSEGSEHYVKAVEEAYIS